MCNLPTLIIDELVVPDKKNVSLRRYTQEDYNDQIAKFYKQEQCWVFLF